MNAFEYQSRSKRGLTPSLCLQTDWIGRNYSIQTMNSLGYILHIRNLIRLILLKEVSISRDGRFHILPATFAAGIYRHNRNLSCLFLSDDGTNRDFDSWELPDGRKVRMKYSRSMDHYKYPVWQVSVLQKVIPVYRIYKATSPKNSRQALNTRDTVDLT
jgi:hypothetical protein